MPDHVNQGPFGDAPEPNDPHRRTARNMLREAIGEGREPVTAIYGQDPKPGEENEAGEMPGEWVPDPMTGLPMDCPVTPMGYDDDVFYIFTARGTLTSFRGNVSKLTVSSWFTPRMNYLRHMCPPPKTAGGKDRNPENFQHERVVELIMMGCFAKGPWRPEDKIRGRGTWRGAFNKLSVHLGHKIIIDGAAENPGEHEGYLYPAAPALPVPYNASVSQSPGGGAESWLNNLKAWNWSDPAAPYYILGWTGLVYLAGAVRWRPHIHVIARKGSGKTDLHDSLRFVLQGWAHYSSNPTEAGLRQMMRYDALGILLDEAEKKINSLELEKIIELARLACSGTKKDMGTQDGQGRSFTIRAPFFFTSINPLPTKSQDKERISVLRMKSYKDPKFNPPAPPVRDIATLSAWGQQIFRRMIDQWARFDEVHEIFRHRLAAPVDQGGAGLDGRLADQQYGHLLTAQHILLYDHPPTEHQLSQWVKILRDDVESQSGGESDNWEDCLDFLMDATPDIWRQKTYRSVRAILMALYKDHYNESSHYEGPSDKEDERMGLEQARKLLNDLGLSLIGEKRSSTVKPEEAWLHIPNKHPELSKLFIGTSWYTEPGQTGQWHGLLEQAPEHIIKPRCNAKYKHNPGTRYGHKFSVAHLMERSW